MKRLARPLALQATSERYAQSALCRHAAEIGPPTRRGRRRQRGTILASLLWLAVSPGNTQEQPEPPSVEIASTTPCDLEVNGAARGKVKPPAPTRLRLAKGRHKIECTTETGIELARTVDLTDHLEYRVFFNFLYFDRFHPHQEVVLDVERGVAWRRAGSYGTAWPDALRSACANLKPYLDQPFEAPDIAHVASLRAPPGSPSTPCGERACAMHPRFRMNSSALWAAAGESALAQIDFSLPTEEALRSTPRQFSDEAELYCIARVFGQEGG
jgi:hypothetical protein